MTLPFNTEDVDLSVRDQAIEKTERRWVWFSNAQKHDDELGTGLGTLGYLPVEIRQSISRILLRGYVRQQYCVLRQRDRGNHLFSYRSQREYNVGAFFSDENDHRYMTLGWPFVFELDSYWPYDPNAPAMDVRLASQSLKVEFEHIFLHGNIFKFDCPKALENFLSQLASHQKALLSHFQLEVWYDSSCACCWCCTAKESDDGWKYMASQLPPTSSLSLSGYLRDPAACQHIVAVIFVVLHNSSNLRKRQVFWRFSAKLRYEGFQNWKFQ